MPTPDGDLSRFDRSKMFMGALTYDEMRPGCYEPKARVDDLARASVDGSLAFPTFPRFCGQTFMEGNDLELGLELTDAQRYKVLRGNAIRMLDLDRV